MTIELPGALTPQILPIYSTSFRSCWLGTTDYLTAYKLQRQLWQARVTGQVRDTLLLLEHPPTLTVGKSGKLENLLVSQEELAERGISLFFTDRGGDVTYHGPGQLVSYPIIDLGNYGKDIHRYIYNLEEVIIRTLADFSICASRDTRYVGVWVANEKIAAIGVAVHRWVTTHGLALNVNPDMHNFNLITACGITDRGVTSMAKLISKYIEVKKVARILSRHFSDVFNSEIETICPETL
jgi:lipoate-protein ligase B